MVNKKKEQDKELQKEQQKEKKHKSKNKKDSQLLLRVNSEERDLFFSICEDLDTSAAREIRRFMREFIAEHKDL